MNMCGSTDFIERQVYDMYEAIRSHSIYNLVNVEYSTGSSSDRNSTKMNLITKVILQDKDGTQYSVEPNPYGLRFAKGEISYKKYKKLQKSQTFYLFFIFFGIIAFFGFSMLVMMKYFG